MGHRANSPIFRLTLLFALAAAAGCHGQPPAPIVPTPPPASQADARYSHLPSWTVSQAADHAAMSLLADPGLSRGKRNWTLGVDRMEDDTAGSDFQREFAVFLDCLRTALFRQSNGRVQLIEKRAAPGPTSPPLNDLHPDYLLSGNSDSLHAVPGSARRTAYGLALTVKSAHTGKPLWTGLYQVEPGHK